MPCVTTITQYVLTLRIGAEDLVSNPAREATSGLLCGAQLDLETVYSPTWNNNSVSFVRPEGI